MISNISKTRNEPSPFAREIHLSIIWNCGIMAGLALDILEFLYTNRRGVEYEKIRELIHTRYPASNMISTDCSKSERDYSTSYLCKRDLVSKRIGSTYGLTKSGIKFCEEFFR